MDVGGLTNGGAAVRINRARRTVDRVLGRGVEGRKVGGRKALIIGKIPKIPPGYALKFEDLKKEDKEAIEFFVQESLKREMSKKN